MTPHAPIDAMDDPLDAEELLRLALDASGKDEQERALTFLKRALAQAPHNARVLYMLAAQHAQMGLRERASDEMRQAVQGDPGLHTAHFQIGLLHFVAGRLPHAQGAWQALDGLPESHALRAFKAALLHLSRDEWRSCAEHLRRGVAASRRTPPMRRSTRTCRACCRRSRSVCRRPRSPCNPAARPQRTRKAREHRTCCCMPTGATPTADRTEFDGPARGATLECHPVDAGTTRQESAMSADLSQIIARHEGYLKLDPDNTALLMQLADYTHRAGRLDEARAYCARCLALDPGHLAAKGLEASVMISQGLYTEAERSLRTLTEGVHPDAALLHNLGVALFHQGRWSESLGALRRAADQGLQDRTNVLYTAHALHRLGEVAEALRLCEQWLARHPDPRLEAYLAILEMDDGQMEKAAQRARALLRKHPDDPDAALVAGMWHIERQEMDVAQARLDTVLKAEPASPRALLAQGLIHLYRHEHAQAIASIEQALQYMPDHVGTVTTLGWAHFAARDVQAAERSFRRALAIDRNFGEAHGGLAVTLVFQDRLEEARREAQIAQRLDPNSLGAVWAAGSLLTLDGKRAAGEGLIATALNKPLTPDGKSALDHLQRFFRQQAARGATRGKRTP